MTDSQNKAILQHLKEGKLLTPLEALNLFGCLRLSGRIYDLKGKGFPIEKEMIEVHNGKRVAQYFMKS